MTQDSDRAYVSQEFILEIVMVFHTRDEFEEEEYATPIEQLPHWTVRELEGEFEIAEGIDLINNALARRFRDPFRPYVKEEVAIDLFYEASNSNLPVRDF
jgi:predicted nucleic-acid-binding protein